MTPRPNADERRRVGVRAGDDLEVVRLVLLRDADLDEAGELGPVAAAAGHRLDDSPRRRRSAGSGARLERGTRQCVPWRSQSARRIASRRATGLGVAVAYRRDSASASSGAAGRMPGGRGPLLGPRPGQGLAGRPGQDPLLAVAHEPGLHQQLDVAVAVGAGDVEARGRPLRALAQELLDQPVADVARIGHPDRVELDDRPLVADALALDADEAGDPALLLVDVHQVVRSERAERQAEQAEHADRRAGQRQAERAGVGAVGLAQARQLAERGEVGQARGADLAGPARARGRVGHRGRLIAAAERARRVRPAAGALARVVVLAGHRGDEPMEARLARRAPGGTRWR